MAEVLIGTLRELIRQAHRDLFTMVEPLNEEQWRFRPTPVAHNIAFQVWHLSRYADLLQSEMPTMTAALGQRLGPGRQIWRAEGLATRWGLDPALLGWEETGSGMADAVAARLALPNSGTLLDYAHRTLAVFERAIDGVADEEFAVPAAAGHAGTRPIGQYILEAQQHTVWDLGYIACLRRAQGIPPALG